MKIGSFNLSIVIIVLYGVFCQDVHDILEVLLYSFLLSPRVENLISTALKQFAINLH